MEINSIDELMKLHVIDVNSSMGSTLVRIADTSSILFLTTYFLVVSRMDMNHGVAWNHGLGQNCHS